MHTLITAFHNSLNDTVLPSNAQYYTAVVKLCVSPNYT